MARLERELADWQPQPGELLARDGGAGSLLAVAGFAPAVLLAFVAAGELWEHPNAIAAAAIAACLVAFVTPPALAAWVSHHAQDIRWTERGTLALQRGGELTDDDVVSVTHGLLTKTLILRDAGRRVQWRRGRVVLHRPDRRA